MFAFSVIVILYFLLYVSALLMYSALLLYFASLFMTGKHGPGYDLPVLDVPGLSIYPIITLDTPLIWLKKNDQKYAKKIWSFLESYGVKSCPSERVCENNAKSLGPCAVPPYGYHRESESPCVYLIINEVFQWIPSCYNSSVELPLRMSLDLKLYVRGLSSKNPGKQLNYVWLSCNGDKPFDRDKIGYLEYYPYPAFDSIHFPYKRQRRESPIVAVKFYEIKPGYLITVRCELYAKNFPEGYHTTFQIYTEA